MLSLSDSLFKARTMGGSGWYSLSPIFSWFLLKLRANDSVYVQGSPKFPPFPFLLSRLPWRRWSPVPPIWNFFYGVSLSLPCSVLSCDSCCYIGMTLTPSLTPLLHVLAATPGYGPYLCPGLPGWAIISLTFVCEGVLLSFVFSSHFKVR